MKKFVFRKTVAAVSAAAIASSMVAMPASAFADDVDPLATGTHVTAAACRAAGPAAEILGMDSVEESGQFVDMQNGVPQYNWTYPKYYLAADPNYDGVRNYDAAAGSEYLWGTADASTYSESVVTNKLKAGCNWINSNVTTGSLVLTSNITSADLQ